MSTKNEYLSRIYSISDSADVKTFYNENAADYDKALIEQVNYVAPQVSIEILTRFFQNRSAQIIDLGCGTGMAGEALAQHGFHTIDGLDYSSGMLEVAAKKGCYRNLVEADLNTKLNFDTNRYHAGVCIGAFAHDHIMLTALDEMFRIIEPGGVLCITMNENAMTDLDFANHCYKIAAEGQIDILSSSEENYHIHENIRGWVNVLRVL